MLIAKFKKENEEVSTAELEALVGLKLPEQYLIFLRKYNGGHTPNKNWTGKCKSDVRQTPERFLHDFITHASPPTNIISHF